MATLKRNSQVKVVYQPAEESFNCIGCSKPVIREFQYRMHYCQDCLNSLGGDNVRS